MVAPAPTLPTVHRHLSADTQPPAVAKVEEPAEVAPVVVVAAVFIAAAVVTLTTTTHVEVSIVAVVGAWVAP